MATSYALLFCNLAFVILFRSSIVQSSHVAADFDLVHRICDRTRDHKFYEFCSDALNSDPRTTGANVTTLAKVAFGLVHRNASSTQNQITSLLRNSTGPEQQHLEQCRGEYATVMVNMKDALTDLDYDTYNRLTFFSGMAEEHADKCESAFKGTKSPLTNSNKNLYRLAMICVSIAEELQV